MRRQTKNKNGTPITALRALTMLQVPEKLLNGSLYLLVCPFGPKRLVP
jgi:hypothetical protein